MIDLLIAQQVYNYNYLTEANRIAVEQLVRNAPRDAHSKPIVTNSELIAILRTYPECGKKPDNPQITCTWKEGDRTVRAYFFTRPEGGMEFQRWDSTGFDNAN